VSKSFLVTGATGNQGGAVVASLLSDGALIRALVREPRSPRAQELAGHGVELVAGDLTDVDAVAAAMDGVQSAFGLTTPGPAEVAQGQSIIGAAQRTSLPHLVLASVASAQQTRSVPHFVSKATIERAARASTVPTTVVAPTWFFENVLARRDDIRAGRLPLALPARRALQCLALGDLGAIVASIMVAGSGGAGDRIELAGDELTPRDMAAALGDAVGLPIQAIETPLPEIAASSADLAAMYRFLAETGYAVDRSALRKKFPEVRWHSFAEWARAQTW
jgi:uncharacterized protein YbjT (DUF2867 family)